MHTHKHMCTHAYTHILKQNEEALARAQQMAARQQQPQASVPARPAGLDEDDMSEEDDDEEDLPEVRRHICVSLVIYVCVYAPFS